MKEKNIFKKIVREIKRPFRFQKWAFYSRHDGLATNNNCDFLMDPRFIRAHEAGKATTPAYRNYDFRWRQRVVLWAAEHASRLEGDFVECGVFRGYLTRMILEYIPFTTLGKVFWLLDTYEGLVPKLLSPGEKFNNDNYFARQYTSSYDAVCQTFLPYKNHVRIIKGVIPDTLSEVTSKKIAYLSIDMNCAAPEIAATEYFWTKLVPGGVVVLDDYGFERHKEQKEAFNRFAERNNTTILPLPTGQGIIIKQ